MFKFNKSFFNNTKFTNLHCLSNLISLFPFELNSKYSCFSLQTNDYLQIMYFKESDSKTEYVMDSSMDKLYDTGKKITVIFIVFPNEVKLNERKVTFKYKIMHEDKSTSDERSIEVNNQLSYVMYKSRLVSFKPECNNISFSLIYYYIHGPIDENNKL